MKKVVIGLSGGVDSSVAACLLKEAGYEVLGVTMETWREEGEDCSELARDAGKVAEYLGISHQVVDFREKFKCAVVDPFMEAYRRGKTPNPCVICNRKVKWEALYSYARSQGADYLATGHYARIARLENGRYALRTSATAAKDQTYALYGLTQEQLSRTLMPVGIYEKDQIRAIAREKGIPVAEKPDSQEICFIPDHDHASFIENYTGKESKPGNFVDLKGNVIGRHKGITHYTVGQRKGLNLAMGHPVFVTALRPETNEVVIGDSQDVFTSTVRCNRLNWMAVDGLHGRETRVKAKIRYNHGGAMCTIREIENGEVECRFDEPVRAAAPGQAVVFYENGYVVGGGTIL